MPRLGQQSKLTSPPSRFPVHIHREWLRYALEILVNNSLRAISRDGGGVLSVFLSVKDYKHAILRVQDTGPGIPEAFRDKLFMEWIKDDAAEGLGIGLMLLKAIAQAYQGSVECVDYGPGTTAMELRLPLAFTVNESETNP
jgi:signal transduction histidine kinase